MKPEAGTDVGGLRFLSLHHRRGRAPGFLAHHIRFSFQPVIIIDGQAFRLQSRSHSSLFLLYYVPGFVGQVLFFIRS
jgi:hypothetical protein